MRPQSLKHCCVAIIQRYGVISSCSLPGKCITLANQLYTLKDPFLYFSYLNKFRHKKGLCLEYLF